MSQWMRSLEADVDEQYVKDTFEIFTVAGLGGALSCVGANAPYAWLALFALTVIWRLKIAPYQRVLGVLRRYGSPAVRPRRLLSICAPALAVWSLLAVEAVGLLPAHS